MPSPAEAVTFGDQTWSRALIDWSQWKTDGLTQHRNWWPDLYRAYCNAKGVTPDPMMLAYDSSYDGQRADLRSVAVST
jgi:hypothetical protein